MNRTVPLLILTLTLAISTSGASHAAGLDRAPQVPVVATWFSNLHPSAGQRETVYVQFTEGNHGLAGGRLSARISYGKRGLTLKGSTTNKRGIARAQFAIPQQARGMVLRVVATVLYRGRAYLGSNHVKVR